MAETAAILLNALNYVLVFVLAAPGLVVVFGTMRVSNMAYGELLTLGAYVVVATGHAGARFRVGVLAAPVVVGLVGLIIGVALIRHIQA